MYRILLVDDEPIIKVAFPKLIPWEETQFRLTGTVSNGKEALDFLESNPVDILITDLKMPILDGIGLIQELKARRQNLPVLVLSNYSDFDLVRQALTLGACDYLLKVNITGDILVSQLAKMAERIQESRKNREENDKREYLMEEQRSRLALSLLKEFFSGSGASLTELLDHASLPMPEAWLAIRPVLVCFPPECCENPKWEGILSHLEDILQEIFGDLGRITILRMRTNELLCCLPSAAVREGSLEPRLNQIDRQISLYFSIHPSVFYARGTNTPEEARNAYLRCREALSFLFYEPDCRITDAESVRFSEGDAICLPISLRSALLDNIRENNPEALRQSIREQLVDCRIRLPRPEAVREYWIQTLDFAGISLSLSGWEEYRKDAVLQIRDCPTLQSLETFLLEAFQRLFALQWDAIAGYRAEIRNAILYIHANYAQRLSLDELAGMVSLNRSYLCRLFKQETGSSLFNYINRIRMEKAAESIRTGEYGYIKELSSSVGIDDPFYFTRRFKEYFGVAPSEYGASIRE